MNRLDDIVQYFKWVSWVSTLKKSNQKICKLQNMMGALNNFCFCGHLGILIIMWCTLLQAVSAYYYKFNKNMDGFSYKLRE